MRTPPSLFPFLLAAFILAAGGLPAGEAVTVTDAKAADPKVEARQLHARCLREGDVWSALQLEAWGRQVNLRLGPVLGASDICGDPLFAFPYPITQSEDRGWRIGIFAGDRFYQLAADGRPLAPSIRFGHNTARGGWTLDGRFAAAAQIESPQLATNRLVVEVRSVTDGGITLSQTLAVVAGDYAASPVAIAGDGTAAVIEIANNPFGQPRVAVARADGTSQLMPGWRAPLAVGSRGTWFIARQVGSNALVLAKGGSTQPLLAATAGPRWTAIITTADRRLQLLAPSGEISELPAAIGIGDHPNLDVAAGWLVLHSGDGAKTVPGRDALDRETPGGLDQPPTLAAWRLAEMDQPGVGPRLIRPMGWFPAGNQTAAFFAWSKSRAWMVDLSEDEPVDVPLTSTGADIRWIDTDLNLFTRIRRVDGTAALLDRSGRPWYDGPAVEISAQDQSRAVITLGNDSAKTWAVTSLDPDAGKRKQVALALDGPGWGEIYADRHGKRVVAINAGRSLWVELDQATGKERRQGSTADPATPRPGIDRQWGANPGRWQNWSGRLLDKDDGETSLAPGRIWSPRDAWRIDRAIITVTHDYRVAITGRKPGDWLDLGRIENGEPWLGVRRNRPDSVVVRANGALVAEVAAGPRLNLTPTPGEVEDLPEGSWRPQGLRVAAPRIGKLIWDETHSGFRPERLRGPHPDRLLVICRSLIINLDPTVSRSLFRPDR